MVFTKLFFPGKVVVAYYDAKNLTIWHVKCSWKIPISDAQTKCQAYKTY